VAGQVCCQATIRVLFKIDKKNIPPDRLCSCWLTAEERMRAAATTLLYPGAGWEDEGASCQVLHLYWHSGHLRYAGCRQGHLWHHALWLITKTNPDSNTVHSLHSIFANWQKKALLEINLLNTLQVLLVVLHGGDAVVHGGRLLDTDSGGWL